MKRLLIFTALLLLSIPGFSQQPGLTAVSEQPLRFFGQCMLNIGSEEQYVALENSLRQNPNVYIVRLDRVTQRAFVLSNEISSLSEDQFRSWFGDYSSAISCIQVGKHGYDQVQPYPFTNCSDN